ncbi:MAG: amidohydrolase [Alphaproteobacteria bacterium]|nr:amidohydrolase [Alphaproteobacteria bacterium]
MSIVIDCDAHIMEPADLWQRYLEPRYRDRAIRIEDIDGVESLIIGEQVVLAGRLAGLGGANLPREELATGKYRYADGCPPASYDPAARLKLMDEWGVDRAVLFPTVGILPFPTEDMDLANAYCRAYNTWQSEFHQSAGSRVIPMALVNWHDITGAAAELARCLRMGFGGVFVPPETVRGIRPGQPPFDPIWRLCDEAGVPGCLHVIVRFGGAAVSFAPWHETQPGPNFTFGLGAPGQLMPAITSLIMDGLFDRLPTLKVVSVEAGCGFAGYLMDRLDEKYAFFRHMAPLAMKPGDYMKRNFYFVAEPEERTIDAMLDLVGEDRIFWGSDFPHIDSHMHAHELIRASVAPLSAPRRARVLGDNAAKLWA